MYKHTHTHTEVRIQGVTCETYNHNVINTHCYGISHDILTINLIGKSVTNVNIVCMQNRLPCYVCTCWDNSLFQNLCDCKTHTRPKLSLLFFVCMVLFRGELWFFRTEPNETCLRSFSLWTVILSSAYIEFRMEYCCRHGNGWNASFLHPVNTHNSVHPTILSFIPSLSFLLLCLNPFSSSVSVCREDSVFLWYDAVSLM